MKKSKQPKAPEPSVFPTFMHKLRTKAAPALPVKKRENIFSKSRDVREDRGERQIKTTKNARTFTHGRPSSSGMK
jgi:hypothetical protein